MIDFKHIDAASTEHALSVLAQYGQGARLLAGGQDLLFRIKKYIVKPECVINLKTIPGLNYMVLVSSGRIFLLEIRWKVL